jgi:transcription antitermination factor NusG
MDSAPINADIIIGLRDVRVSYKPRLSISCGIDEKLTVAENIKNIINACVDNLYPKMIVSEKEVLPFTDEQKKALLLQGFTVEQIHEKEKRHTWVRYILIRFNEHGSTIDYIEEITRYRYRAHLYQPLMMVKDKILALASGGREGMEELYRYIISISKQEILNNQKNEGEECDIQESL